MKQHRCQRRLAGQHTAESRVDTPYQQGGVVKIADIATSWRPQARTFCQHSCACVRRRVVQRRRRRRLSTAKGGGASAKKKRKARAVSGLRRFAARWQEPAAAPGAIGAAPRAGHKTTRRGAREVRPSRLLLPSQLPSARRMRNRVGTRAAAVRRDRGPAPRCAAAPATHLQAEGGEDARKSRLGARRCVRPELSIRLFWAAVPISEMIWPSRYILRLARAQLLPPVHETPSMRCPTERRCGAPA